MNRLLAVAAMLVAAAALAEVGKVATLEGKASRTPRGGASAPLTTGSAIELGDTLEVQKGNLKLELTDGSVIMLREQSKLVLTEAEFQGQERKGFKAFLESGSLWTRVKKALGGGSYEISTERAVAGVRGTIFRIDADALLKAAKGQSKGRHASIVRVVDGVVNVKPTLAVARASTAAVPRPVSKGPRTQVPGPSEISKDEWEKRFVDLQKGQQIAVGVDLWEQAELDAATKADAFSKWIEKHQ